MEALGSMLYLTQVIIPRRSFLCSNRVFLFPEPTTSGALGLHVNLFLLVTVVVATGVMKD